MVKYYSSNFERFLGEGGMLFPWDKVIHKMEPSFCHIHFMEFWQIRMNKDVLEQLVELDDTLPEKWIRVWLNMMTTSLGSGHGKSWIIFLVGRGWSLARVIVVCPTLERRRYLNAMHERFLVVIMVSGMCTLGCGLY